MFPSKDVRILVSLLARDHVISLQEVPKSNDRAPARTLFLWTIDLPTSLKKFQLLLYKVISNLLIRQNSLRLKNQALLIKLGRSDVQESGDKLLTSVEVQAKSDYYKAKEMMDVEIQRLERLLFILTRLPG